MQLHFGYICCTENMSANRNNYKLWSSNDWHVNMINESLKWESWEWHVDFHLFCLTQVCWMWVTLKRGKGHWIYITQRLHADHADYKTKTEMELTSWTSNCMPPSLNSLWCLCHSGATEDALIALWIMFVEFLTYQKCLYGPPRMTNTWTMCYSTYWTF